MSLQWSENLASGSSDIDTQHKELFLRVNSLLLAVDRGPLPGKRCQRSSST